MKVLVAGVLLVAALLTAGVLLLRDPAQERVRAAPVASLAPDAQVPAEFAQAACVRVRLAAQGIAAGSAADVVRSQLAAARALAAEALRGDGAYAALSGGLAVLDEAVRRDDPAAADVGLRTVLEACGDLA